MASPQSAAAGSGPSTSSDRDDNDGDSDPHSMYPGKTTATIAELVQPPYDWCQNDYACEQLQHCQVFKNVFVKITPILKTFDGSKH